ncbi:MAG: hypothetical protein ACRDRX_19415 [Pseudonocardiaceae bacterium]
MPDETVFEEVIHQVLLLLDETVVTLCEQIRWTISQFTQMDHAATQKLALTPNGDRGYSRGNGTCQSLYEY